MMGVKPDRFDGSVSIQGDLQSSHGYFRGPGRLIVGNIKGLLYLLIVILCPLLLYPAVIVLLLVHIPQGTQIPQVGPIQRDPEFPLLKRLNGEKNVLDPGDYYYLGFHLVEGAEDERRIGAEILERIVEATPRSKIGKSAKSKLRLEGLL